MTAGLQIVLFQNTLASMPYRLDISPDAQMHLAALRKFDQTRLVNAMEMQLRHEPLNSNRNRKPMRSNLIATWELRVGHFRVYYDVSEPERIVWIRAIGIKQHGTVIIGGQEIDLS